MHPSLADIALRHGLRETFPEPVVRETDAIARSPGIDDPAILDRESLPMVTIDSEHSRDLDQAICVAREGDGFRVDYAIADAAHYVLPGSALFAEALARGASFYLPSHVVPMLPEALSTGVVSLNPNVARRAMLFRIRLDAIGHVLGTTIERARIKSRKKCSFAEVQRYYEGEKATFDDAAIDESLALLRQVGELRLRDAESRAVVRFRRTEIDVHREGLRFVALESARLPVEQYNEQISLLCNQEGARLFLRLAGPEVQPIFRVHEPPNQDRVAELEQFLAAFAAAHGERFAWRADGGVPLATFLHGLPDQGRDGELAEVVHRHAVMTNVRSRFASEVAGHFGVGTDAYARFSAPMREIVGVFAHKEAWEALGVATPRDRELDDAMRELVITRAQEAKAKQRSLDDAVNLVVLEQLAESGGIERGIVMGIAPTKLHVRLDAPPIDVKIYLGHVAEQLGETVLAVGGVELRTQSGRLVCRAGDRVALKYVGRDPRGRLRIEVGA